MFGRYERDGGEQQARVHVIESDEDLRLALGEIREPARLFGPEDALNALVGSICMYVACMTTIALYREAETPRPRGQSDVRTEATEGPIITRAESIPAEVR